MNQSSALSLDPHTQSQGYACGPSAPLEAIRVKPAEEPVPGPIEFVVRGIPCGPRLAQLAAFAFKYASLFTAFIQPFDDRVFWFAGHMPVLWLRDIDTNSDRKCQWVVTDGVGFFVLPVHAHVHTREQVNPETYNHPSPLFVTIPIPPTPARGFDARARGFKPTPHPPRTLGWAHQQHGD